MKNCPFKLALTSPSGRYHTWEWGVVVVCDHRGEFILSYTEHNIFDVD